MGTAAMIRLPEEACPGLVPDAGPGPDPGRAPVAAAERVEDLVLDYRPRRQFVPFHDRRERFACIVTHRRAGKTVASIEELQRGALSCPLVRPRFGYLSPFIKQSKEATVLPARRGGSE